MKVRVRTLYHIVDKGAVDSILNNGLMTGISDPKYAKGHLSAVYLTNDWKKLTHDKDFNGTDKVVLQVDATGLPLIRDDNYPQEEGNEWAWYTEQSIEPDRIHVLGKLSQGNKLIRTKNA